VSWGNGWWACQDLNLGPHPYQQSGAYRYATLRCCRSCSTVRGQVMRCSRPRPEPFEPEPSGRPLFGLESTQVSKPGGLKHTRQLGRSLGGHADFGDGRQQARAMARSGCRGASICPTITAERTALTEAGPPGGPAGGGRRTHPRARAPRPRLQWRTRHQPAMLGPSACSGSDGSSRRARPR
jgi:hypothetical protein